MLKGNNLKGNYIDCENVKKLSQEQQAMWNEMFSCREDIEMILRSKPSAVRKGEWGAEVETTIAAYILARVCEYNNPVSVKLKDISNLDIDKDILEIVRESSIEQCWEELCLLTTKYRQNVFYLVSNLKSLSNPRITPDSICALAEELLEMKLDDTLADICCGSGSFALRIKNIYPEIKVSGYDINRDAIAMAKVYSNVNDAELNFENRDVFELGLNDEKKITFSKVFGNYPFGMRIRDLNLGREYIEKLTKRIPGMSKATSSDWVFNMLITDVLSKDGKAVGVMTNGSTWNISDKHIRKYFIENGLIESVIALPPRLFNGTGIETSMVVFSHGNKGVRLVDASEQFAAGRRINEMTDENIDAIIAATKYDSENSIFVELEELRENDYVLSTTRYMFVEEDIEDGMPFESVIKRITRGAPMNAKQLDEIASEVPTNMQYLMLANIKDGLIEKELPYISKIEKKNEKYCLSNNCLIMSKNGYPYKIAVAEIKEGQKVLANGNLYIIELDEEKVDPYYLAAFFSSESGIGALKRITVGRTMPNIGVDQLKKLIIPIPELSKQKEIAQRYKNVKNEIVMLQFKLDKARNRMSHIFEEGGNADA